MSPFDGLPYVEEKGWCAAADLEAGDHLHTQDGRTEIVLKTETEQLKEAVKVYNMEIEDWHTYYVSDREVLVHNEYGVANESITDQDIKNAMKDAPLQTQQKSVSKPVIKNYADRIMKGETNVPPIKVDGNIIVDGNHRYIASRIVGFEIDVVSWSGGNQSKVIDWMDVILDPIDWGNR